MMKERTLTVPQTAPAIQEAMMMWYLFGDYASGGHGCGVETPREGSLVIEHFSRAKKKVVIH